MYPMNQAGPTIVTLDQIMTELNRRGVTCESIAASAGIDTHTLRDIRLGRCLSTHMETALRIAKAVNRNLQSIDWGRVSLTAISGTLPGQSHGTPRRGGAHSNRFCPACNMELPLSSDTCFNC